MDASITKNNVYNSSIKDFFSLLKPRVMTLVVFTGGVGMFLAPGQIHPFFALIAIFCISLGSGAAGAINMWYESDIDSIMNRTKNRPIPAGRISRDSAIEFGVLSAFASVLIMSLAINIVAGLLLLCAILFYVFIYTIGLKRITPQNIVIGGAAGAFPPMIGWAAVTSSVSIESVMLFLIIFLWTPPHFWALALYKNDDYKKAGIPMLPVVKGSLYTRVNIVIYTIILLLASIAPYFIGMFGEFYLATAVILGGYFAYLSVRLYKNYSEELSRKTFKYSLLYLFLLFSSMPLDRLI